MQNRHYKGQITEWYDDWLKDREDDIDYYSSVFKGFDKQVLELACGTGRLLVTIAKLGIHIDGLDASEDMLSILQRKTEKLDLKEIKLYNQPMENFNLSTQYDAIFVAGGSFQLLASKEDALKSLSCIHHFLSDSGFIITDIFIPWDEIIKQKQDYYQVTRDVSRQDGTRSIVLERFKVSLPEQIKHGTYRYEFYNQTQLTECIVDDMSIRWYWKDEFLNLLKSAGFSKVEILTDSSLYEEGYSYVFKAFK
jgi:ubiquinone/menaquinone biosynthesis C-methylase UbiE